MWALEQMYTTKATRYQVADIKRALYLRGDIQHLCLIVLNTEAGHHLELVDADNRSIGLRFEPDMVFDGSLLSLIWQNTYYGCTQVFNRDLFLLLRSKKPKEELITLCLHDSWASLSAAACGTIVFDPQSHIRYRRHGNNFTTFDRGKAVLWKKRFFRLLHRNKPNSTRTRAREAIRLYSEAVEKDPNRDLIEMIAGFSAFGNRIALIRNRKRFTAVTGESRARFVLKVITGLI